MKPKKPQPVVAWALVARESDVIDLSAVDGELAALGGSRVVKLVEARAADAELRALRKVAVAVENWAKWDPTGFAYDTPGKLQDAVLRLQKARKSKR